jgi:PqqD family protein of HPr-rel-A system
MTDRYLRLPTAVSEAFIDGTVVFDHGSGATVRLNPAAACVWDALESPRTLPEIAATLAERFGIPVEQALADVRPVLADLERRMLLSRASA